MIAISMHLNESSCEFLVMGMVAFLAMVKMKLSVLMQLIKLLGGKSCLRNGNVSVGEAIIERMAVTDAEYISELIPEEVCVQRV